MARKRGRCEEREEVGGLEACAEEPEAGVQEAEHGECGEAEPAWRNGHAEGAGVERGLDVIGERGAHFLRKISGTKGGVGRLGDGEADLEVHDLGRDRGLVVFQRGLEGGFRGCAAVGVDGAVDFQREGLGGAWGEAEREFVLDGGEGFFGECEVEAFGEGLEELEGFFPLWRWEGSGF